MSSYSSILTPLQYTSSTCGYCSSPGQRSTQKTSHSYGIWAHTLSLEHYETLINAGWRRSGHYIYKPDLLRTCCKQISIRLEVDAFQLGRSSKKAMKECKKGLCEGTMDQQYQSIYGKGKGKGRYSQRTSLQDFFATIASGPPSTSSSSSRSLGQISSERQDQARQDRLAKKAAKGQEHTTGLLPSAQAALSPPPFFAGHRQKHRLTTRLVPAKYTDEKYALFRRYQMAIHKEGPDDVSKQKGFSRFLCENPFEDDEPTAMDGEHSFGSYHMEWYLDDQQLIAVGVLDLLPHCLSSVYLFYDPEWEHLQLGKMSALREILLVEELQRGKGLEELRWYYLGYYIHNCQKMRYKAGYKPSQILDVTSKQWHLHSNILPLLDAGQTYDFDHPPPASIEVAGTMADKTLPSSSRENGSGSDSSDSDDDDDEVHLPLDPLPPGIALHPFYDLADTDLARLAILEPGNQHQGLRPYIMSSLARATDRQADRARLREGVSALGPDLAQEVIFFL